MTNCYYCEEFDGKIVPVEDLFCNEQEHDLWAKKHYGSPKRGGQRSIKDIQERLLKMGKQVPKTTNGQLFEDVDEKGVSLDH